MIVPTRLLRTKWPPNDDLTEERGSPRFITLLDSIRRYGIQEPLTMRLDWCLIDGHHRLAVARLLGIESVDVRVWTGTELVS